MADVSAFPPSPPAPSPLSAAGDVTADALLAPWPLSPWPAPLRHGSDDGRRPNPLFAILPLSALAIGLLLLVAVAVILVLTRRAKLRLAGAGGSIDGDKSGAPASSCGSSVRGSHNARVHLRREARPAGAGGGAAAEPGRAGVHVPGAGARDGRVQRGQRAGAGRVRRGLPRAARRRHPGRHQAAAAGPPAPGRARVPRRGGPPEPDALAAPGGTAGLLRRPEPPAAGVRVDAQRLPQEPPAPRRRRGPGPGGEAAAAARAGLADASEHRAGLRPRAGVPARAHLPRRHPPGLQLQQRPPRPQLPRPRLRFHHRQGRLQQGQRPGPHPRPRHHRLPRARVRVDGEADDQVGRVQLRGGAPRAADRPGAGGHAATAGTARPGFMGASTADEPREARADGGPGPERPVRRERSRPGCRHRGDVRADQGGVPAADDGRGAVADPHREEPRHVLLLHAREAPATRRPHEPAAAPGISRRQRAVEHDGLEFSASCTYHALHGAWRRISGFLFLELLELALLEITLLYSRAPGPSGLALQDVLAVAVYAS